jgi:hypothetical protein
MNTTSTHTNRIAFATALAALCLTAACGVAEGNPPEQSGASASDFSRPPNLPRGEEPPRTWFAGHTTPPPSYWIGWEVWQRRSHVL